MKRKIFPAVFLICLLFFGNGRVFAASAGVELIGESIVTVGDEFEVTLKIESEEPVSGMETYISYSDEIGEFSSADSGIAGGKGLLRINIRDMESTENALYYGIRFTAKKAGTFSIYFSDDVHLYTYDNDNELSVSSTNLEIKVKSRREASSDSSLSNLKVAGLRLSPAFSKGIFNYSVNIGKEVEELIIGADPSDANSKVTINGNKDLKEGINEVQVTVTAEDGSTTVYNITAVKEAAKDSENEEKQATEEEKTVSASSITSEATGGSISEEGQSSKEPEYVPDLPETDKAAETDTKDSKQTVVYGIIVAAVVLGIMLLLATVYFKKTKKNQDS